LIPYYSKRREEL